MRLLDKGDSESDIIDADFEIIEDKPLPWWERLKNSLTKKAKNFWAKINSHKKPTKNQQHIWEGTIAVVVLFVLYYYGLRATSSAATSVGAWFHNWHLKTLGIVVAIVIGIVLLVILVRYFLANRKKNNAANTPKDTKDKDAKTKKDTPEKEPTTPKEKAKNIFGWALVGGASSLALALALPFLILAAFLIMLIAGMVKEGLTPVRPAPSTYVEEAGFRTIPSTIRFERNPRDEFAGQDRDSIIALLPDPKDSILIEIAACESHLRQFRDSGRTKVLRGAINHEDIGVFQINDTIPSNRKVVDELGEDIFTLRGNVHVAQALFTRDSVKPWRNSVACWRDHIRPGSGTEADTAAPLPRSIVAVVVAPPSTAPADTWSERVQVYNRALHTEPDDSEAVYVVHTDISTDTIMHGVHAQLGNPAWMEYRSLTPQPVKITVSLRR